MKKKLLLWSLLLCIAGGAFTAAFATALTSTWKVTSETAVAAKSTYLDDDLLTVKTVFATTLKEQAATIDGVEFTHYIQVRNAAYPSADVPTGTENSGSTSLVVTAKKNAKLKLYYRHQSASTKKDDDGNVTSVSHTQNDGKDLKVFDQADPTVALEGDFVIHTEEALAEYKYVTKEIELLKDHVYTLSAKGTTLPFYGLSAEEIEDIVIPTDGVYYQKVTSSEDITDGDYLIVYESEKVAFDGSLATLDAAMNTVGVTISNGLIASSKEVDAAVFTFNLTEMSIKSASGKYVGITSYSNGLKQSETLTDKFKHDSFEIDQLGDVIIKKTYTGDSGGDMILNFNAGANDKRFRYYKEGSQKKIQLYKKIGTTPPPAVATPVITGETPFFFSTAVTITCETQDAIIYYTTDGTDPTDESTEYKGSFDLTASATVKAIAYDATGASSDVASKGFVANSAVANIAALNALENNATFGFTGEALVVAKAAHASYSNRIYVFIKDETGSSLIYDADASKTGAAEVGKTIAANWTGKVSIYKNLFEAVPDAALSVKDGDPVEVTYPEAQLSDIKAENVNQVIELKGVTYEKGTGSNLTIYKGPASIAAYKQLAIDIPDPVEGKTYSIVGAIGRYNDNIQFWPISIEEEKPAPLYIIGDMNNWNRSAMIELGFNEKTQAYEYSIAIADVLFFAFATYQMTEEEAAADEYWTTFNTDYRYSLGQDDVDASGYVDGDPVQLVKGKGAIKLPAGDYKISVTKDFKMTITSNSTLQYDAVYVAGNAIEGSSWMNGITWDPLAAANKMTPVDGMDDVWEITFKDVSAYVGYAFKFVVSGSWSEQSPWDVNFGGDFVGYGLETPAAYNANSNIVFNTTAESQDITLRINLSDYNHSSKQGATFTVIAPAEKNAYVVAGCVGNNGETGAGEDDVLFGKTWDATAEANQLALDEESGLYTLTYKAVDFENATSIFYKVVINGVKWIPDGANQTYEIPAAGEYDIVVTYDPETGKVTMKAIPYVDIIVNPEDITDGDITKALADKIASYGEDIYVKDIYIYPAAGESYTMSGTLSAPNSITLQSVSYRRDADANAELATITMAEGMTGDIITLEGTEAVAKKADGTDSDHKLIADVTIDGVALYGLKGALVKDAQKTLVETLTISNAIVEMPAAAKNVLDFSGQGYAGKVTVVNSTIYAKDKNTGFFAQYGSRPKNVNGDWLQEFDVQASTFANIANGKNFCDLKQNGTAQNVYTIKNNVFADCGKSGQTVVGFNKGQNSPTPVWDVEANIFNANGTDTGAAEVAKAGQKGDEDIVKNSVFGRIAFTSIETPDLGGTIVLAPDVEAVPETLGDPRWAIEYKNSHAITIDTKFGNVTTVPADYAAEGEVVTITAKPNPADKFELVGVKVEGVNTDLEVEVTPDEENPEVFTFTMPADAVIITATFRRIAEDIIVNPEDIEGGDIAAALDAKIASYDYLDPLTEEIIPVRIKNIYIYLAGGEEYTLTKTLTAPNSIIISGTTNANDELATIHVAEGVTDDFITLNGTETLAKKADGTEVADHKYITTVIINGVAIYDLKGAVVKDAQKTWLGSLAIYNSIIQVPDAQKNVIDFNGKGYVGHALVLNSTIYAEKQNTGFFAQYGSRPKNIDGNDTSLEQELYVQNSTFANIANGKNFCDLKQKGTAQNVYTIKNCIFADCGKQNQVVVGFNGGQSSAAPQWDVDGNVFNWQGNDSSAEETAKAGQKDGEDIVKNSLACRVLFSDVEKPDFGGIIVLAPDTEAPDEIPGDPRWEFTTYEGNTITVVVDHEEFGTASAQYPYAIQGEEVGLNIQPIEGYEVEAIIITDTDGILIEVLDNDADVFTMYGEDVYVYVTFKKTTTDIDTIENAASLDEGAWFTINGVRIDKPTKKGLYIHNGRKVVMK